MTDMRVPHASFCAKICGAIASLPTESIRRGEGEASAIGYDNNAGVVRMV